MNKTRQASGSVAAERALSKARAACGEAFRLICSDDARREGFFRKASPLVETFPYLNKIKEASTKTDAEAYLLPHGGLDKHSRYLLRPQLNNLLVHNEPFSVRATIYYYEAPGEGLQLDSIDLIGIRPKGEQRIDSYWIGLEFRTWLAGHFYGNSYFIGWTGDFMFFDPFDLVVYYPQSITPKHVPLQGLPLQESYGQLVSMYPENDYEIPRIALNLLAEFEAMLGGPVVQKG